MNNSLLLCTAFVEDESGFESIHLGDKRIWGKWVTGYYVCLNSDEHRIYTGFAEIDCGDYYPDAYTVIPDTVCRFTGLFDINNYPIYQSDIVNISFAELSFAGKVDFQNGSFGVSVDVDNGKNFYSFYNFREARIEIQSSHNSNWRHGHILNK